MGSTLVESSFALKYKIRLKVYGSEKHSSLLQNGDK